MAGTKTFINETTANFQVTLFIRAGENPVNQDGSESFTLEAGETVTITYGNETDSFLNGILLFTIAAGDLYSSIQFTTIEDSLLDVLLNTNSNITITKQQTEYILTGSNPPPPTP